MHISYTAALPLLALCSIVSAQTFTDCNPMEKQCPPDTALGVANYSIDFTQNVPSPRVWNTTAGSITTADDGAEFIINQRGDAPTVQTNFKIFFGQVEVIMKASAGQGIVSSIVLLSDDLDEIDWEFIGGNNSYVETNYFGKGNTTSFDRAIWYPIENPQGLWHNYTLDWSKEKIDWIVDGNTIRTLNYSDANGGLDFPQTPCDIRLGIWAGGDPKNSNGTIEWAGGLTDYSKAPFTMPVKSVRISDASRGTQYEYTDKTGSFESIKSLNVTKPLKLDGANGESSAQSAKQKWNSMSKTHKIIIASVVGGVIVLCAGVFAICCIKQRRAGKHEKLVEDAKFEKNASEMLAYRAEMSRMRSEQLAQQRMATPAGSVYQYSQVAQTPVMNGAANPQTYNYANQQHAGNAFAVNNNYANNYAQSNYAHSNYAHSNYAPSVNTYNSGRGYQRY